MSLTHLKDQVAQLQDAEQRQLIAYLFSLRAAKDDQYMDALSQKIDDNDPSHWMELDEVKKRYST